MSETTPSSTTPAPSEEISLDNIDALLESEDPEFSNDLKGVAAVAPDANVVIESSTEVEDLAVGEKIDEVPTDFKGRLKFKIKSVLAALAVRLKTGMAVAGRELLIFLKTRPKEFFFFVLANLKLLLGKVWIPVKAFQQATSAQKTAIIGLFFLVAVGSWVTVANLKGIWLPQLNEPILNSLETHATGVTSFDPQDEGESFYSAFPQERHEYLFPKIKVNLARTEDHPLPMGAFEIVVLLDSKDTAIEVADRKVEFFDIIQRTLEEETFSSLETEIGKTRAKSALKRELNQKLTQGWVKDINFKTFILKP
jgi:flagellar basal body-associated protein FliL